MVLLDQYAIVETDPVIVATTTADSIFLRKAKAREGLACVKDANVLPCHRLRVAARQGVVGHAGHVQGLEVAVAGPAGQFAGLDELVVLVGAARQPAQNIFCPDNGQCKGFQRAVEGCQKQ